MFTKKVGTMKPGWSQQPCVPRGTQPFGLPATSHPGMPAHDAFGFPHGMQALCSQAGKVPGVTVKFVCTPVGNGITCPSAVTHGSWRHAPEVPPQSAAGLHVPKRFAAEVVVHRFSPEVTSSGYGVAIASLGTMGAHVPTVGD